MRLWEGRTGKFVATLRGHVGAVYRLAWSADSRMLISASKDSTLKVKLYILTPRFPIYHVLPDLGPKNLQDQDGPSRPYGRGLLCGFCR